MPQSAIDVAQVMATMPHPHKDIPNFNPTNLKDRMSMIRSHYPEAVSTDDFMSRVEVALCAYGFTGDNSIAMTNLCRDEVTAVLKDKIESIFGASFNTNGLGAVLTCGVLGVKAGLSHSPQCRDGRERYVFFSFPHIGIDALGDVGSILRPGRPAHSHACGALIKCLTALQAEGSANAAKVPGVHDPMDPEYTILKQRLARRLNQEKLDISKMNLVQITALAERMITDDLEYLIEKAVDTKIADYAVVTGIQVHNWASDFNTMPSLEFIVPAKLYVCAHGKKTSLDLTAVPPLPPRQLQMFSENSMSHFCENVRFKMAYTHESTITEIPLNYLALRGGCCSMITGHKHREPASVDTSGAKPSWQVNLETKNGLVAALHHPEFTMGKVEAAKPKPKAGVKPKAKRPKVAAKAEEAGIAE